MFNPEFQRQSVASPEPTIPDEPAKAQYGYGIERQTFAPNATMYYHFGEMPGFNAFSGYDPGNKVTLVIWSNLTVGVFDGVQTAQSLLNKVAFEEYRTSHRRLPRRRHPARRSDRATGATAPQEGGAPVTSAPALRSTLLDVHSANASELSIRCAKDRSCSTATIWLPRFVVTVTSYFCAPGTVTVTLPVSVFAFTESEPLRRSGRSRLRSSVTSKVPPESSTDDPYRGRVQRSAW